MLFTFRLSTDRSLSLTDITANVKKYIRESGCRDGIAVVFTPHTTAGITINENADPHVQDDITWKFRDLFPPDESEYLHGEGNSHSHVMSTLTGASVTLIVKDGNPLLGVWQGIYFCEFDGPRMRTVHIKIMRDFE